MCEVASGVCSRGRPWTKAVPAPLKTTGLLLLPWIGLPEPQWGPGANLSHPTLTNKDNIVQEGTPPPPPGNTATQQAVRSHHASPPRRRSNCAQPAPALPRQPLCLDHGSGPRPAQRSPRPLRAAAGGRKWERWAFSARATGKPPPAFARAALPGGRGIPGVPLDQAKTHLVQLLVSRNHLHSRKSSCTSLGN